MDKPLKPVTHDQCDARPTVTFPAIRHRRPLTAGTNTAWWQRHMCVNNLPSVVTRKRNGRESNCDPLSRESNVPAIPPPGHTNISKAPDTRAVTTAVTTAAKNNARRDGRVSGA